MVLRHSIPASLPQKNQQGRSTNATHEVLLREGFKGVEEEDEEEYEGMRGMDEVEEEDVEGEMDGEEVNEALVVE